MIIISFALPELDTVRVNFIEISGKLLDFLFQVCLPLLILHGEFDSITDPSGSKGLYEKASCTDKKLCLYEDSYHALMEGEPDEIISQVLDDIFSWLDNHVNRVRP